MTPLEYLFAKSEALEDISRIPVRMLPKQDIPELGKVALRTKNAIAFQARKELERWAFYRLGAGSLEVASPFGCCALPIDEVDASKPIGLLNVQGQSDMSAWTIEAGATWRDARGRDSTPQSMKASALDGGGFEPLHSSLSFRGIDSKPDFWTVVLLPAKPDQIQSQDGQALIESGGRRFMLPSGRASEDVLAGKVQWGLPDETGFFVLQPR